VLRNKLTIASTVKNRKSPSNMRYLGLINHVRMQCFLVAALLHVVHSFQSHYRNSQQQGILPVALHRPQRLTLPKRLNTCQLNFFGRKKEEDKDGDKDIGNDKVNQFANNTEKKSFSIPFFGRLSMDETQKKTDGQQKSELFRNEDRTESSTLAPVEPQKTLEKQENINNPDVLFAKAERARLEAERMDAELTLYKIDKLERQLVRAKSKGDSIDDLQRQLDSLQAKLRGDSAPFAPISSSKLAVTIPNAKTLESPIAPSQTLFEDRSASVSDQDVMEAARKLSGGAERLTEKDLRDMPDFVLKIQAALLGMEGFDIDNLNMTEFLRRWESARNMDYSFLANYKRPTFTPAEISDAKRKIQDGSADLQISKVMIEKSDGNATQLALYALEYEAFLEKSSEKISQIPLQDITPEFIQEFLNQTAGEAQFLSLYPKCTRKEGGEPTQAQVDALVRTVLPLAKYSSSSKPIKVAGGYVISGTHNYKNGDDLIDAIDRELAKSSLADKLTVLYAPGRAKPFNTSAVMSESLDSLEQLTLFEDIDLDPEPILYITGPDIVRESNPIGLTITSILGIASSWYLSIYPYLLNNGISNRVDQELELLEANLQPDLTWLTDLSLPLFVTFLGLQLVHDAAHRLVAASNDVKLTLPTFVPSLITGITSSVTTFKTLPKNKNAMFDISAAGPLAGIAASLVTLALGCKLTLISDPSLLPCLPLDILRQSTLGGAIVDYIVQGSLYFPEGASTAGIMISLHPVAIAGYISLIVNALSLLPIGSEFPSEA
jgi:hypothetical protein